MTDGNVLLITGASSGIGRAVAQQAAERGYRLALLARSSDKLAELKDSLACECIARSTDVTVPGEINEAVKATLEKFGRIDAVFANAGTGGAPGGISGADHESWKALLMTNVYGLALTLQATAEALKASKGHAIITSSIAGRRSLPGSMYSASKWAATGIGHGFRKEIGPDGVRVTLIEPGLVNTAFFEQPKPDMLQPEDVARTVLFALEQPPHMEIHELVVLPIAQQSDNLVP